MVLAGYQIHQKQATTPLNNRLGYDIASEAVGRNWLVAACRVIGGLLVKSGIHPDLGSPTTVIAGSLQICHHVSLLGNLQA